MNQLISKTITLIIGFSIAFSSAIPMQNANAYVTKVEVVSPIEIAAEPSSTFPDIQSSASLQVEAQSVGRSNEPEYEVIQNDDPYLMSLALGYEELKANMVLTVMTRMRASQNMLTLRSINRNRGLLVLLVDVIMSKEGY